jgi:glycosyltransferase involved in cell wall biosynthesis
MRIAFVTPEYVTETDFSGGGLANYLHRVARGLVERGHEAEIFTLSKKGGETLEHDGVKAHRVRPEWKWFFRLNRLLGQGMPISKGLIVECYSLRREFLQRHNASAFDIVQAPNFRASGLALTISSPVPVVTRVSSHSRLWDEAYGLERTRDLKMREWLERQAIRRSARVYAPSAFLAGIYTDEFGFNVDVVRPPFFLEEARLDFSVYEERLKGLEYVIFVGAVGRLKGAFVLADAMTELLPRFPKMHFALAGFDARDATGRSSVERIKEKLSDFGDRVHCLGPIPHARLYPLIQKARVVALPSLVDNLPNSCMEAMALGSVVVASRGASFDELIEDGKSGLLAELGNPRALAESIGQAWCLTEDQRARVGGNAKKSIASLAPETTLAQLEALYASVIADCSKRKHAPAPSAKLENWSKATEEASVAARKRQ